MKENTLNRIWILCGLLAMVIAGCKTKKQIVANHPAPVTKPKNDLQARLNVIRAQQADFNTFSGKAKTSLNINGNSNDCTLNIRINSNKKIWVSVTALLGIEVARAVITPDSILVINRLQSVYLKKPFSFIHTYTNSHVDFPMLQALLVGNAIPSLMNDSTKYLTDGSQVTLSGNLQDLVYKMAFGVDLKVTETDLTNDAQGQSLQVSNSSFIMGGTLKVPAQITIASAAKNRKVQVNLHYTKVDFNLQQDYPFNIPDGYSPSN